MMTQRAFVPAPGIPLYLQIQEDLRRRIADGLLGPGEQLPAEDELSLEYGVSRMTARRAITALVAAGAIYRRHGLGTFVAHTTIERDHTRLTDFFANCRAEGIEPSVRVVRRELVPATSRIARALNVPEHAPMIRIETLRLTDGVPITLHDAQVAQARFPWLFDEDLEQLRLDARHLWQVLEEHGCRIARARERLEARVSSDEVAALLELPRGAPILYGARIIFADDGTPVKYADCYNRGDRFSLIIEMLR